MKNTFMMLLSVLILSCDFDINLSTDKIIEKESISNYTPIFVGNDSILYLQKYSKTRHQGIFAYGHILAAETRLKVMNIQGQDRSTIWHDDLNSEYELLFANSISYSIEARKVFINFTKSISEDIPTYGIMIIDLNGNLISYFIDDDFSYKISEGMYGIYRLCSSPDGLYYSANNKIKNTSGDLIKTINRRILDWNRNGILVRDTSINMNNINIEGNDYNVYSHPTANSWLGTEFNFIYFENDSLIIGNWHDPSISQRKYFPYLTMDYDSDFNSSMISPDSKYLVCDGISCIQLFNLSAGGSQIIKEDSVSLIH